MRVNKLIFLILVLVALLSSQTSYSYDNQLDINNATRDEIGQLPVTPEQADALFERVIFKGPFSDIYQVLEVKAMDRETWNRIKPLIWLEPYEEKDERDERIETILYQIERLEGAEGFNQALMDSWLEKALDPIDINTVRYDELLNMQNVNAVDAAALFNYREEMGNISSTRNLRSIPGLSYYGYRNMRNFVRYEPDSRGPWEFHGHVMVRQDNTPFYGAEDESGQNSVLNFNLANNSVPRMFTKGRFSLGSHVKFGLGYLRNVGEPDTFDHPFGIDENYIPRVKMFAGVENLSWGGINLFKLYLGSYLLGFGQGIVMETVDEFTPRKNGMGYRKRLMGISPDLSINRQWYMNGVAAEFGLEWLKLTAFYSKNTRDAILSKVPVTINGQEYHPVNQFIVLNQRISEFVGPRIEEPFNLDWVQSVEEMTYGGHIDFHVPGLIGTRIGATYYESLYDHPLEPDVYDLVEQGNERRVDPLDDAEILNAYGGPVSWGTSSLWSKAISFRRVYGVDFSTVVKNVEFAGEYAELDKNKGFGINPSALVLNMFAQWDSFNFFALYRNYDLQFDNPYQRSFSNYQRYKGSILEDYFYLESPAFGQLYSNAYQPQSEEGIYLSTRYQLSRTILLGLEFDNFERKTDAVEYYRWVARVRYSPIFPLRFYIRYKDQSREKGNDQTPNKFFNSQELRIQASFLLSGYDGLGLFYSTSSVLLNPRPRLSYPAEEGGDRYDKVEGQVNLPGYAIGTYWTHNFNTNLKFKGAVTYYKGFLWNFEDTQFVVLDNLEGSMRYWGMFFVRLNEHLSLRLKYTIDRQVPVIDRHARDLDNERDTLDSGYLNDVSDGAAEYSREYQHVYFVEFNYYF